MDLGLKDKVAVVTGGSKGIGFAAAKAFLQEGAKVAVCARHKEELELAAKELGRYGTVYWEVVDVTNQEANLQFAEHVAAKLGGIHAWVNNVGATGYKKGEEYDDEEIDFMTAVCFKSVIYGCQAAFRYMKESGGTIVNVSSLAARCPSAGRSTLYGPLKAAVNNLTVTFAGEYCAYNIRVNCVMPGFTATPLVRANISQEELDRNAGATLLKRGADPEEIAKPIVFLAGNGSSYMTAATVEVSGGRSVTLNPAYAYEKLESEAKNK